MMKHEPHGRNRIRLLAMYHLQLGKSFKAISEIVKSHWKTVQSWLRRFRHHGFEGLFES
ncbi:helix-turn-helix domain-containing protein [Candidatus Tisiphia endosymbiont of Neophilaenus lineatus]